MEEWRNGGMEEWRNGGMEEWRNGGMEEWMNGRMDEWKNGRMEEWAAYEPRRLAPNSFAADEFTTYDARRIGSLQIRASRTNLLLMRQGEHDDES